MDGVGLPWYTLTGHRPDPELEGWGWFFRDHIKELSDALGPKYADTKREFEKKQTESQETLERYFPHRSRRRHIQHQAKRVLMGPAGWLVAAALIIWDLVKVS